MVVGTQPLPGLPGTRPLAWSAQGARRMTQAGWPGPMGREVACRGAEDGPAPIRVELGDRRLAGGGPQRRSGQWLPRCRPPLRSCAGPWTSPGLTEWQPARSLPDQLPVPPSLRETLQPLPTGEPLCAAGRLPEASLRPEWPVVGLPGQVAGALPCPPQPHLMRGPPPTSLLKLPWAAWQASLLQPSPKAKCF